MQISVAMPEDRDFLNQALLDSGLAAFCEVVCDDAPAQAAPETVTLALTVTLGGEDADARADDVALDALSGPANRLAQIGRALIDLSERRRVLDVRVRSGGLG